MIEAVNTVLQNAPVSRASSEQVNAANSFAANPEGAQRNPLPQAPFISPHIHVDLDYDRAVLQLRNGETGDVIDQFPSEATLKAQARQAAVRQETRRVVQEQSLNASADGSNVQPASSNDTAPQQTSAPAPQTTAAVQQTAQQQAAFAAAAQAGNTNAGSVTVFA